MDRRIKWYISAVCIVATMLLLIFVSADISCKAENVDENKPITSIFMNTFGNRIKEWDFRKTREMFGGLFKKKETSTSLVHNMNGALGYECVSNYIETNESVKFKFGDKLTSKIVMPGMSITKLNNEVCEYMAPQGIAYYDGYVFATAYCSKDKHNSVVYVIDAVTKQYVTTLVRESISHSGGVTYANGYLWVCDGPKKQVAYYKFSEVKDAIKKGDKSIELSKLTHGVMAVDNRASYITTYKDYLCVGTFDETSESGNKLAFYYPDITGNKLKKVAGLENLPTKSQSAVFHNMDGKECLLITTSHGRWNTSANQSKVYIYEIEGSIENIKLTKHIKTIIMPPMMEEATVFDNKVYFVFESCASKYRKWGAYPIIGNICGFDMEFVFK